MSYYARIVRETRGEDRVIQLHVSTVADLLDRCLGSDKWKDMVCDIVVNQIKAQHAQEEQDAIAKSESE